MILYSYYRSSCSYRVRIALNLKGLDYDYHPIHLLRDGGEQKQAPYRQVNPQQIVPSFMTEDGTVLTQSLAIIEYLEEAYPKPALLPVTASARAEVRAMAAMVACEVQPLNNLRVLQYLTSDLSISDEQKNAWYVHWIEQTFVALEASLQKTHGHCCYGDEPTIADLCLIPQIYNAERFNIDLTPFPLIIAINQYCLSLEAFHKAQPELQIDAN